jgi:hypothetical protein
MNLIYTPDRKYFFLLIKIISTRYLLIFLITRKYLVDMILINPFRSGSHVASINVVLFLAAEWIDQNHI